MAAGILNQPLTHAEVMETGKAVEKKFSLFMKEIISLFCKFLIFQNNG